MKSRKFSLFFVIAIGLIVMAFVGCSRNEYHADKVADEIEQSDDVQLMLSYLVNEYGFSRGDIVIEGGCFIVERDMIFEMEGFWGKYKKSFDTKAHYRHANLVSSGYRRILVTTPNAGQNYEVPQEWLFATVNAISAWNSLNGGIRFIIDKTKPYDASILVVYGEINGDAHDVVAKALYPTSSGKPGDVIVINAGYTGSLSANERTQAMIHELGHCIGFMHTDSGSGTLIAVGDQNITDPNSVMQANLLTNPQPPYFSQFDIAAYNLLYP